MPESSSGNQKMDREKRLQGICRDLRALLISAPNGLNVIEIQNDYQSIIGKPFPYREMGYKSALDLLQALPDVVKPTWIRGELILRGVIDEKCQRVASLISRQRKVTKKRATRVISKRPVLPPVVPAYVRDKIKELLAYYPSGLLGSMFCQAYERHSYHILDFSKLGFSSLTDLLRSIPNLVRIESMKGGGFRVHAVKEESTPVMSKVNTGNKGFRSSSGGFSRQLSTSSDSSTREHRDTGNRGFRSSSGRFSRHSSTSSDSSTSMLELDMIDTKKKEVSAIKKLDNIKSVFDSQNSVSKTLRQEIAKILNKRPNGVWSARLPVEYKKMFKKELVVRDHGFTSVIELADAIPDVLRIERPTKTGDWLLISNQKEPEPERPLSEPKPTVSQATTHQLEARPVPPTGPGRPNQPLLEPDSVGPGRPSSKRTLPVSDGVGLGVYFSKLTVPETGYVDVYITHTTDPHDFWLMLINNYPKLEALAEDIRFFYNSPEGMGYLMPDWFVAVGQVCCALYEEDGAWYRALITSFNSIHNIEVFYVDYGNRSRVALHNLRILRSSFIKLPAQSIHAQLAYIKPAKGNEWTPGCCHRFYHITKDFKPLVGLFCGTKDETISVCLCDTSQADDIHINDELVEEGYAVFNPPASPPPRPAVQEITTNKGNPAPPLAPPPGIRQAPGLPPPSTDQQFFNAHAPFIPAGQAPGLGQIPDFPLHFNVNYNNDILSLLNGATTGPNVKDNQDTTTDKLVRTEAEGQDAAVSQEDLEFMEEICCELEEPSTDECLLKSICLMDICSIHIINRDKKPYVTSADISALFWDSDSLRTMLRQKKMSIPKVVLSQEENGALLDEMVRCGVRGAMDGESPRTFVTIYELQSLPKILQTFNHPSEELLTNVLAEIEHVEKEGNVYWLMKDDDEGSESTETESESQDEEPGNNTELALEELKLVVQAMQFRRKRIIQSLMTSEGSGAGSSVDELLQVESKIEALKRDLERRQNDEIAESNAIPNLVNTDHSEPPREAKAERENQTPITERNTKPQTTTTAPTSKTAESSAHLPQAIPPKAQPTVTESTQEIPARETRSHGMRTPVVSSTASTQSQRVDNSQERLPGTATTVQRGSSTASTEPRVASTAASVHKGASTPGTVHRVASTPSTVSRETSTAYTAPRSPNTVQAVSYTANTAPRVATGTTTVQAVPRATNAGQRIYSNTVQAVNRVPFTVNTQQPYTRSLDKGVSHPPSLTRPPLLPDPPISTRYASPPPALLTFPTRAPPGLNMTPTQRQVQMPVFRGVSGGGAPPMMLNQWPANAVAWPFQPQPHLQGVRPRTPDMWQWRKQ